MTTKRLAIAWFVLFALFYIILSSSGCKRSTLEQRACVFCEGDGTCILGYMLCVQIPAGKLNANCRVAIDNENNVSPWLTKEHTKCVLK